MVEPSRAMVSSTSLPTPASSSASVSSGTRRTVSPSTATMTSPSSPVTGFEALKPGRLGGRAGHHAHDDHASHAHPGRHRLVGGGNADAGRRHPALGDDLRHDAVDRVDGDGKADAGVGAGGGEDGGVDPDDAAGGVEQGPARIAGIDRGVGLDHVGDLAARRGRQAAGQRADHARRQGLVEAEGVADGESRLAHLEVRRRAHLDRRRQARSVGHVQHRKVVARRGTDRRYPRHLARCQPDEHLAGALDDMVIGHHVPGLVPHEAGAGLHVASVLAWNGRAAAGPAADHLDDGGRDLFEDRDGGGFSLRQVGAGDDLAGLAGQQVAVDVGLGGDDADDDQQSEQRQFGEAVQCGLPRPENGSRILSRPEGKSGTSRSVPWRRLLKNRPRRPSLPPIAEIPLAGLTRWGGMAMFRRDFRWQAVDACCV
jgi:hypothetical protein